MDARNSRESRVEMMELVMPNDANALGTLFGGKLMQLVDMAAGMAAARHARGQVVTASIDSVWFDRPILVGNAVHLVAEVTWVGRTSMEVYVAVHSEDLATGRRLQCNTAYLTFVAIDAERRPRPVPPLLLESEAERQRCAAAEERRRVRLAQRQGGGPPGRQLRKGESAHDHGVL